MADEPATEAVEDIDSRPPTNWLNYPGDCRKSILARATYPMGPSDLNEMWFPVCATYDEEAKTTKVGFTLIPHPNYLAMLQGSFIDD